MDIGLIGKKYWIVETKVKEKDSIETRFETREDCRIFIRNAKEMNKKLGLDKTNAITRKIYKITIINQKGTQICKHLSS